MKAQMNKYKFSKRPKVASFNTLPFVSHYHAAWATLSEQESGVCIMVECSTACWLIQAKAREFPCLGNLLHAQLSQSRKCGRLFLLEELICRCFTLAGVFAHSLLWHQQLMPDSCQCRRDCFVWQHLLPAERSGSNALWQDWQRSA